MGIIILEHRFKKVVSRKVKCMGTQGYVIGCPDRFDCEYPQNCDVSNCEYFEGVEVSKGYPIKIFCGYDKDGI